MLRRSTLTVRILSISLHCPGQHQLVVQGWLLQVMLSVCLVLAGYTLLLHHKLSFAVGSLPCRHNLQEAQQLDCSTCAILQEDKQGFTVTEMTVSNDDQVSYLPPSPTPITSPGQSSAFAEAG